MIYGAMGLGGEKESATLTDDDKQLAYKALNAAREVGITTIDTADIYRAGRSDLAVAAAFEADPSLKEHFRIQTKFSIRPADDGRTPQTSLGSVTMYQQTPDWLKASLAGSLKRLGVDHIDTLLIHRPDPLAEKQATAEALQKLIDEKVVGRVGVSNMHTAQLEAWSKFIPISANQLQLSLARHAFVDVEVDFNTELEPTFGAGTIEWCLAHDVELQSWSPVARGLYVGDAPIDGDEAQCGAVARTRELVCELADRYGVAPTTIVLAWVLRHPAKINPVIGSTNPQRIRECAAAKDVALTREEWYALYTAARGVPVP